MTNCEINARIGEIGLQERKRLAFDQDTADTDIMLNAEPLGRIGPIGLIYGPSEEEGRRGRSHILGKKSARSGILDMPGCDASNQTWREPVLTPQVERTGLDMELPLGRITTPSCGGIR